MADPRSVKRMESVLGPAGRRLRWATKVAILRGMVVGGVRQKADPARWAEVLIVLRTFS